MKTGSILQVAAVNTILLLGMYLVAGDMAARASDAARESATYYFSQGFLVEVSTLLKGGGSLRSPWMLSWLQVLFAVLVIIDVAFVYGWARRRQSPP